MKVELDKKAGRAGAAGGSREGKQSAVVRQTRWDELISCSYRTGPAQDSGYMHTPNVSLDARRQEAAK